MFSRFMSYDWSFGGSGELSLTKKNPLAEILFVT